MVPVPRHAEDLMAASKSVPECLPPGLDEDCLSLNVYTPDLHGSFPTLVWFYGGNLTGGSACSNNVFDPAARQGANPLFMAKRHNIVIVTANYRLNAFGFLNLPGGDTNCGLTDAALAL